MLLWKIKSSKTVEMWNTMINGQGDCIHRKHYHSSQLAPELHGRILYIAFSVGFGKIQ